LICSIATALRRDSNEEYCVHWLAHTVTNPYLWYIPLSSSCDRYLLPRRYHNAGCATSPFVIDRSLHIEARLEHGRGRSCCALHIGDTFIQTPFNNGSGKYSEPFSLILRLRNAPLLTLITNIQISRYILSSKHSIQ
jgi:hypothetical protein